MGAKEMVRAEMGRVGAEMGSIRAIAQWSGCRSDEYVKMPSMKGSDRSAQNTRAENDREGSTYVCCSSVASWVDNPAVASRREAIAVDGGR